MKIAEAESLEAEIQKLREENATLRRQADELATVESALKKAESRAETLEEKVCIGYHALTHDFEYARTDGYTHTRASYTKGKRTKRHV